MQSELGRQATDLIQSRLPSGFVPLDAQNATSPQAIRFKSAYDLVFQRKDGKLAGLKFNEKTGDIEVDMPDLGAYGDSAKLKIKADGSVKTDITIADKSITPAEQNKRVAKLQSQVGGVGDSIKRTLGYDGSRPFSEAINDSHEKLKSGHRVGEGIVNQAFNRETDLVQAKGLELRLREVADGGNPADMQEMITALHRDGRISVDFDNPSAGMAATDRAIHETKQALLTVADQLRDDPHTTLAKIQSDIARNMAHEGTASDLMHELLSKDFKPAGAVDRIVDKIPGTTGKIIGGVSALVAAGSAAANDAPPQEIAAAAVEAGVPFGKSVTDLFRENYMDALRHGAVEVGAMMNMENVAKSVFLTIPEKIAELKTEQAPHLEALAGRFPNGYKGQPLEEALTNPNMREKMKESMSASGDREGLDHLTEYSVVQRQIRELGSEAPAQKADMPPRAPALAAPSA